MDGLIIFGLIVVALKAISAFGEYGVAWAARMIALGLSQRRTT